MSRSPAPDSFEPCFAGAAGRVLAEAATSRADTGRAPGLALGSGLAFGSKDLASPGLPLIGGLGNRLNAIATAIDFHDQRDQLCSDSQRATSRGPDGALGHSNALRFFQIFGGKIPVEEFVDHGLDIVGPPILVIEVIGVLPDIDGK